MYAVSRPPPTFLSASMSTLAPMSRRQSKWWQESPCSGAERVCCSPHIGSSPISSTMLKYFERRSCDGGVSNRPVSAAEVAAEFVAVVRFVIECARRTRGFRFVENNTLSIQFSMMRSRAGTFGFRLLVGGGTTNRAPSRVMKVPSKQYEYEIPPFLDSQVNLLPVTCACRNIAVRRAD